jgi:hypothetical protein
MSMKQKIMMIISNSSNGIYVSFEIYSVYCTSLIECKLIFNIVPTSTF